MSDILPSERQLLIRGLTIMRDMIDAAIQMAKDGKPKDEIMGVIDSGMKKVNDIDLPL